MVLEAYSFKTDNPDALGLVLGIFDVVKNELRINKVYQS